MISRLNSSKTINLLSKGLDTASKRHKTISNNIANVDTPGFKTSGVSFENSLKKVLNDDGLRGERTHGGHMRVGLPKYNEVAPEVYKYNDTNYRNDKNNVDIDVEVAKMAKNKIYFEANTQRLNGTFQLLNDAIQRGGGRA
ncbi:MAG: flagellar basal body rod protein FlgB [Candidatus Muiribacteriota bacterium]